MARSLTLADGQLGTTAATLLSGADAVAGSVSAVFTNTSAAEQTVILTFRRSGGTARRIARAVLAEHEQLRLDNLPMQPDDTLLGYTSNASAVDYLVVSGDGGAMRLTPYGATGSPKSTVDGEQEVSGSLTLSEVSPLEDLDSERNSLLRRLVLGIEMLTGTPIPDPA